MVGCANRAIPPVKLVTGLLNMPVFPVQILWCFRDPNALLNVIEELIQKKEAVTVNLVCILVHRVSQKLIAQNVLMDCR